MCKQPCFILLLAFALCTPAWAVNKCTGADGKVTFQDTPCAGATESIAVQPASGRAHVAPAAPQQTRPTATVATSPALATAQPPIMPMVQPIKTQLEAEADMCLAWYKPLLKNPAGAYYSQPSKDGRVVRMTIHGSNSYGGYVTKQAACEIHMGKLDEGWTKKHAGRDGW